MSGEILFLAHRTPFPPDRGDKIRSHHVLDALARIAPVHVGCLAENEADMAQDHHLARITKSHWMPTRARPLPLAGLSALVTGKPVSFSAFEDASLKRWVEQTLADHPIETIYVYSGQMGQYVPQDWQGRLVVDFVDVDSAKFEAYAEVQKGPMRFVHAREGRLLRAAEAELARRADLSLLVSEQEAELMRQRCPQAREVRALRNGIDCAAFDPTGIEPHPELAASSGPHFVFTGQMDYAPNICAVKRFARKILPGIRARHPDAAFHIVGRAPTPAVEKLAQEPGTQVWGEVPDMRPFILAAGMVVAPLTIARGVQNKVLEAMAMGKTVLASPEAVTGIDGNHAEHFLVCHSNADFVASACAMLEWRADCLLVGQAARQLVCGAMSWPAMLADLPAMIGMPAPAADHPVDRRDAA